jgi:dTDP-4-amino-4,6-dideoxygalactose transaminase
VPSKVVLARLDDADIEAVPLTFALGRLTAFAALPGVRGHVTPIADELHDRAIALPLWLGMRSEQLDRVCDILHRALQ